MIYDEIVAQHKASWKPGWTPQTTLAPWDVKAAIAASYRKARSKSSSAAGAHATERPSPSPNASPSAAQ